MDDAFVQTRAFSGNKTKTRRLTVYVGGEVDHDTVRFNLYLKRSSSEKLPAVFTVSMGIYHVFPR